MQRIFMVVDGKGAAYDIDAKTLRGAKISASQGGYKKVAWRNANHYYVNVLSEKKDGYWQDNDHCKDLISKGLLKR